MTDKRVAALNAEEMLSVRFQLGIMRNVEREMSSRKRKMIQNWQLVRDYMLCHTSHGGSTSCHQHCQWLGVDPEGYTFWPV